VQVSRVEIGDGGGMNALTLGVSFMFPCAKGEPLEFVVMSDVPTRAFGTAVGIQQIGFPDPWGGFQFFDS
jgi:hypothetical protein